MAESDGEGVTSTRGLADPELHRVAEAGRPSFTSVPAPWLSHPDTSNAMPFVYVWWRTSFAGFTPRSLVG